MDDQRFDRISRVIASSTSRRGALKGIAAAIGGGALVSLFGVRPQRAAAAEPGEACLTNNDCTVGTCINSVCACEDPAEPWRGCSCSTGTEAPCGGGTLLCCATDDSGPGGPGVCTSSMTGCDPTGGECTADPGDSCTSNEDCCQGSCSEGGVCYCEDPSRPLIGCWCDPEAEGSCGDNTLVCCSVEGGGVCTSGSVGCNPTGECTSDPGGACTTDSDCCEGRCSEEGVCYCSDPARPWIGCSCNLGTEAPCGGTTAVCCPTTGSEMPGGVGVCTSDSVGCQVDECNAFAGGACESDADCCEGSCSEDGVCYCLDPAEPQRGCVCSTEIEDPCGSKTLLCCPVEDMTPGSGICTPDRLGCEPTGECGAKGDSCKQHDDCCGYLHCLEGVCSKPHHPHNPKPDSGGGTTTVPTLPSTGSGPQSDELSPWLGAAALAGAAAIAARKLQPNSQPEE